MSGGMVSLRDYDGIQGFGVGSSEQVEDLNKALSAGVQNPPTSGGNVLRVQSLEATLRIVTFSLGHIKLWKNIPKLPAFSTVEEYNRLTDYGADAGAFTDEGALPESQDSTYERKTALVKFLGTTREVTHPMTLVRPAHGNVIALETQNGAIWLVERLERALFNGDSAMIAQEIDGLKKQILDGVSVNINTSLYDSANNIKAGAETVIIDKRGLKLTEDDLEVGSNYIVQNYGVPTNLYSAPQAMSDLAKQFYPRERVNLPLPTEGKVGFAVSSFQSNSGLIQLDQDIFLRSGRNNGVKTAPSGATSSKAPTAPASAVGAAPGADAKSMFGAADAGAYIYFVTAVNQYGESVGVASAAVTYAAGEAAVVTITDGGGSYPATAYKIYRSDKGGLVGTAKYVTTVARAGGTTPWTDYNWLLPACSTAFMVQQNLQNFSVRQLAPMMKIPLATVAASIRWMQLLYLTMIVYTPKKNVLYINVADS